MKGDKKKTKEEKKYHDYPEMEPATTQEGREQQLAALAYDEVEQRIRNHDASAMELVYFMKLNSENARLERAKIEAETRLQEAKIKAIESSEERDRLYADAIAAFRSYVVDDGD